MSHSDLVKNHFDFKYSEYDVLIRKLIPQYDTMHSVAVKAIDAKGSKPIKILDLGIGTGETALRLLKENPNIYIEGYDISPNMLGQGEKRLSDYLDRVKFIEQDISNIQLDNSKYDACIAVLSIHHLEGLRKLSLFKKVFGALKNEGVFVIADIVKFDSEQETKDKEKEWKKFLDSNLGQKGGDFWFANYREEDRPSSVREQVKWLESAGFRKIRVLWELMNYAVITAIK